MLKSRSHPDQLNLGLALEDELERVTEARTAQRAETDALRWRFRLVVIESVTIASLLLVAGIALEQPTGFVLRGAAMVGAGCFLTGLLLIVLTAVASIGFARWRRRP